MRQRLMRVAVRILGDDDLAQDILQESFIALWSHYGTVADDDMERLAYRVVRNKSLNGRRDGRRSVPIDEGMEIASHEDETAEMSAKVWQIVEQRLTPLQREIVKRTAQQGQKPEEIAAEMGKTVDAVYQHLSRARQTIKTVYLKEYENQ